MNKSVKDLSAVVKQFLTYSWDGKSPLLVAYSGGPDSKALLYASLEWGKAELHVAHADHAWRKESAQEAQLLRAEVEGFGIPFHSARLANSHSENEAREFRYDYFRLLKEKIPYQAILLGHQADDLAETVLKRIFEGAHLPALWGMRPISQLHELELWRPLLSIRRVQIEEWLTRKALYPLHDPTNRDRRYLRARMRSELLPFLNKQFGKNISANLLCLSERSSELDDYLREKNHNRGVEGELGVWIEGAALPRIELRALIQECLKRAKISITRIVLEQFIDWIKQKKRDCRPLERIIIHQGDFFVLKKKSSKIIISELKKSFLCIGKERHPLY